MTTCGVQWGPVQEGGTAQGGSKNKEGSRTGGKSEAGGGGGSGEVRGQPRSQYSGNVRLSSQDQGQEGLDVPHPATRTGPAALCLLT